jgi:hypothetical protein
MPSRNELNARARVAGLDPANYPSDSRLEQKILYLEKNATAITGTAGTQTITTTGVFTAAEVIVIGSVTYTMRASLTGAKATQTLTATLNFSEGETVSVEGQTYTFRATPSNPYDVDLGVDLATSLDNLKLAINAGANAGEYGVGTVVHPLVTATTNTNTTQVVEARDYGTRPNNFLVSETCTSASWGAATLAGGVATVPNEVLIGADAAASLDNLKSAINDSGTEGTHYSIGTDAHPEVNATTNTDTTQVVAANNFDVTNASIATTTTAANATWGAGTLASGADKTVAAAGAGTRDTNAGIAGDKNV